MSYDSVTPSFIYWRSSSLVALFHWSCKYILIDKGLNVYFFKFMLHLSTESLESAEASDFQGSSPGFWCLGRRKMRSEFVIVVKRKGHTGGPMHGWENGDRVAQERA
jgi:hypothetical protein